MPTRTPGSGLRTARAPLVTRVAMVVRLYPGPDGMYGGACPGGRVYNLEVEGTHTYLIGGGDTEVVVHNCHHATASSYRGIYDALPEALMLGVTATMSRTDGEALGKVWQEIVYSREIIDMIRLGHLADAKGVRVRVPDLDLRAVRSSRGDYAEGQLGDALEASLAPETVASAYAEHAKERKGLLFAPTVDSAGAFADALNGAGIVTDVISGDMNSGYRKTVLRRFSRGETQVLANCMVLTEGFDSPEASAVVIARPTKSQSLYIQMAGRALRPHPAKDHALVLDVVGASEVHSLRSMATLLGREPRPGLSLLADELEREQELGAPQGVKPVWDGEVFSTEVDLFGASRWRWRQTAKGLWFISTEPRRWFLVPGAEPGTWDVAWRACKTPIDGLHGDFFRTGLPDVSMAMSWAEQGAAGDDPTGTIGLRDRAWHRKRPSEKSLRFAASIGVVVATEMRAGEVSDAIDHRLASRALDATMIPWLLSEGRETPMVL